ncbi:UDP-glycosyltransferase 91A1-like [Carica papaya]|uniref:UDP-glycosyltransferase 91A1-like n=1 Tax=Carica papaya TaxID=3649 RepID=UPI000B8CF2A3|nr:UDP-glycosyltransferase 91A1-like [Carica papaya]
MELEPEWLHLVAELHRKPVVPLGLLPPSVDDQAEKDDSWVEISKWLNQHEKDSVVYVALGSEAALSQRELTELALGLELSGLPFFWALKISSRRADFVKSAHPLLELPEGYEDRIKGRGIVWASWAPQLRILSHDSVGGFLTHCGWSSIIEGAMFGRALAMLPFMVDQGLNARVMEERKVGVLIPRNDEQDGLFTRDGVAGSLRLVMADQDKEGSKTGYKENARKMAKLFGDRELHEKYMDGFLKELLV